MLFDSNLQQTSSSPEMEQHIRHATTRTFLVLGMLITLSFGFTPSYLYRYRPRCSFPPHSIPTTTVTSTTDNNNHHAATQTSGPCRANHRVCLPPRYWLPSWKERNPSNVVLEMTKLTQRRDDNPMVDDDAFFDPRTTLLLIGAQSMLILLAVILALITQQQPPNFGLGQSSFSFDSSSVRTGGLLAIPLGVLASVLDTIEERYPALQDVTKATQRSVLGLLGGTFKPVIGTIVAVTLGIVAGVGEEMLFRGWLQNELISWTGLGVVVSISLSSILFGFFHAVTPLYATMASLASAYFGVIYVVFDNLAVPIACHSIYDIGALLYAHWTVSRLTRQEQVALITWTGPD